MRQKIKSTTKANAPTSTATEEAQEELVNADLSASESTERVMWVEDITSHIQPDVLSKLGRLSSRLALSDADLGKATASSLLETINSLPSNQTCLIDFAHATTNASFLLSFLQCLFFPKTYDSAVTDRPVKSKKVVIANPDDATLLGIAQCLELAHTHCMIVPNTEEVPWKLLYAGHLESRFEILLRKLVSESEATAKSLAKEGMATKKLEQSHERIEIVKVNQSLKQLYDFGLVNRDLIKLPGQRLDSYQYTFFHPYQHYVPHYRPVNIQLHRMPRPPYVKRVPSAISPDPAEEPEPLLQVQIARRKQHHSYVENLLREWVHTEVVGGNLNRITSTWRYWEEAREVLSVEQAARCCALVQEALHYISSAPPSSNSRASLQEGYLLYIAGILSPQRNRFDQPREFYLRSLSKAKEAEDITLEAIALSALGRIDAACSEYSKAWDYFVGASRCAEKSNARFLLGRINLRMGTIAVEQNDYKTGVQLASQGLTIARLTADVVGEIEALILRGKIQGNQGHRDIAYESYQEATLLCSRFGYQRLGAIIRSVKSVLDWNIEGKHNHIKIAADMGEAAALLRDLGDTRHEAHALINRVASLTAAEAYDDAYHSVIESLILCSNVGDKRAIAFALEEFARLSNHFQAYHEGVRLCAFADAIRRDISSPVTPEQVPSYQSYIMESEEYLNETYMTHEVFHVIWLSVRDLSIDDAIKYALETSRNHMSESTKI